MTNAPVIAIHIILNDIKDQEEKKEFIESVKKENPQAYKEYRKQKQKLETIKLYPYRINRERLRERLQELKDLKEYVPTRLGFTLGAYTEITDTIKEEYEDSYTVTHTIHDPAKFLDYELFYWLTEHKDFEDLIEKQ